MASTNPTHTLPDILGHGLRVIFCGINPGIDAAAAGHHFLGRGNRFWPVLHLAGFTPYQVAPENDQSVLDFGLGLTAAVARPTARAEQIRKAEFSDAAASLMDKVKHFQPYSLAFLGKAAYSGMTGQRDLSWGEQPASFAGARVWILPNPSGLNRAFTKVQLVEAYGELQRAITSATDAPGTR